MMKLEKKINTDKIKIKYLVNSYRDLQGYPTPEDVVYELIKDFCSKGSNELKFTNESIKNRYSLTESECSNLINKLVDENIIIKVKEEKNLITYNVIFNPFV